MGEGGKISMKTEETLKSAEKLCRWIPEKLGSKKLNLYVDLFFHPTKTMQEKAKKAALSDGAMNLIFAYILQVCTIGVASYLYMLLIMGGRALQVLPILALMYVIGLPIHIILWLVYSVVQQYVAKFFGGKGKYEQLAYVNALITATATVFGIPFGIFQFVPCVGIITIVPVLAIALYTYYLQYCNVRKVHGISQIGAALAVILSLVPLIIYAIIMLIVSFVFIAPMLGTGGI